LRRRGWRRSGRIAGVGVLARLFFRRRLVGFEFTINRDLRAGRNYCGGLALEHEIADGQPRGLLSGRQRFENI
jgi:hypothetical protein